MPPRALVHFGYFGELSCPEVLLFKLGILMHLQVSMPHMHNLCKKIYLVEKYTIKFKVRILNE